MTLKKAIEVLNTYQSWRIGEEDVDMQKPSVVTEAINTLLDFTDSPEFFANMSEKPTNHFFDTRNMVKDKIVQQVVDKFNQRSEVGIKKYGTTLEQNNNDDYFTHLQEELMDAILYIEKLKSIKYANR